MTLSQIKAEVYLIYTQYIRGGGGIKNSVPYDAVCLNKTNLSAICRSVMELSFEYRIMF